MMGLMIAAPASGSGKTTVTLGLLRALKRSGVKVAPVKCGPDYIDPAYHTVASGEPCFNLDPWGMRQELISALVSRMIEGGKVLIAEGMMGLFDAAIDGKGASADLARTLDLPIVLVVDCSAQAQSIGALVSGFSQYRRDIFIAGVILNRVAGPEHEAILRRALDPLGIPVVGVLPFDERLALPERHLGLVQAGEHPDLEHFLAQAADIIENGLDISALRHIWSRPRRYDAMANVPRLKPIGTNIAIARDDAFAFAYPHIYDGWRRRGVHLSFFSPLADEAPSEDANAIYLPGGYPELYAEKLANAKNFRSGMKKAAERGANIYGECGGYMVLGETLETEDGVKHKMLGLLPLETTLKQKKLRLGYRLLEPLGVSSWQMPLKAHEFHCANIVREGDTERLFRVRDASGADMGTVGLRVGNVAGSFMHIIDFSADAA